MCDSGCCCGEKADESILDGKKIVDVAYCHKDETDGLSPLDAGYESQWSYDDVGDLNHCPSRIKTSEAREQREVQGSIQSHDDIMSLD